MGFPLPDIGSVTEDSGVVGGFLSTSGDADFGPWFNTDDWVAETISGLYGSSLTIGSDGTWTYTANNANASIQALDTGETLTEVFTVTGNTMFGQQTTTITITINGADEPPCFVAGTLIETANGPRPVEELRPGDEVLTRDRGLQALRWVGGRRIDLTEEYGRNYRPVRLRRDALAPGVPDRDILLSPMHRVLIRSPMVELLCGQTEIFCPAKSLVNGQTITWESMPDVGYHHLLFDRHEVVVSSGCESESFYPGEVGLDGFEEESRQEVLAIFPELRSFTGAYGNTVRPVAKRHEAKMLAETLIPTQNFLATLERKAA